MGIMEVVEKLNNMVDERDPNVSEVMFSVGQYYDITVKKRYQVAR